MDNLETPLHNWSEPGQWPIEKFQQLSSSLFSIFKHDKIHLYNIDQKLPLKEYRSEGLSSISRSFI